MTNGRFISRLFGEVRLRCAFATKFEDGLNHIRSCLAYRCRFLSWFGEGMKEKKGSLEGEVRQPCIKWAWSVCGLLNDDGFLSEPPTSVLF